MNKLYTTGDGLRALMCQHAAGLMHAGKTTESVDVFTEAASVTEALAHMRTHSRSMCQHAAGLIHAGENNRVYIDVFTEAALVKDTCTYVHNSRWP